MHFNIKPEDFNNGTATQQGFRFNIESEGDNILSVHTPNGQHYTTEIFPDITPTVVSQLLNSLSPEDFINSNLNLGQWDLES